MKLRPVKIAEKLVKNTNPQIIKKEPLKPQKVIKPISEAKLHLENQAEHMDPKDYLRARNYLATFEISDIL